MTKKVIQTEQAPKAIGPYSQGVATQEKRLSSLDSCQSFLKQGSSQEVISLAKLINH